MRYTTVSNVRELAGFVGNSNVSDAYISSEITRAQSYINSYISDVYALPLGTYYKQTIVFSGTGTGSDTLTITIDGSDYDVAITNGLTASDAADLFRSAAADNSSFVIDGIGDGTTVTIYSIDDGDSTDVTITSTDPDTVEGITATGGTVTAVAPPMAEALASNIAAAYTLITEYGPEAQDTDKDGFKRLAEWTDVLKRIAKKEEKLFDFADNELPRSSTKRLKFFPKSGSEDDNEEEIVNQVTMNQKF